MNVLIRTLSGVCLATSDLHELTVADDGHWAIATNYRGGNCLSVFDLQGLSVACTVGLSRHPEPHVQAVTQGDE